MFAHQKSTRKSVTDSLLYPSAQVYDWGTTLVVSPHPNHEVLGCGGAMALLRQMGFRVHILFVGDGSNDQSMEALAGQPWEDETSSEEICNLIGKVGVSQDAAVFLNLKENLIPQREQPGFEEAVRLCMNELEIFQPETILFPFLDQGDRDVQATWQIIREAARQSFYPIRMIEYRLWSWSNLHGSEDRTETHRKSWRLDIKEVIDLKISALDSHLQQQHLLPWRNADQEMLVQQANPWEVYLEYNSLDMR
ncbi:MAG: PIG-L family deacetylase [Cyclobacteriaceae bacterium]